MKHPLDTQNPIDGALDLQTTHARAGDRRFKHRAPGTGKMIVYSLLKSTNGTWRTSVARPFWIVLICCSAWSTAGLSASKA